MGRIIAAGHLNWDVTLRVKSLPATDGEAQITGQHRAGGGSAANVASALAGLDLKAGLVGSVGDDEQGRMATRELAAQGVDVSGVLTVENGETTVKFLIVDADGEVMVLANDGVNEAIEPADLEESMLDGFNHVHLTGQRPETAAKVIELAQATDRTVSFDPGRQIEDRAFEPLLDEVEVLLLNELEAKALFPAARGTPLEQAAGPDRVIVVKRGGDGASVYTDSATVHHPGFSVETVDTTGAGDAFAAGFLAATLGGLSLGDQTVRAKTTEVTSTDFERVLAIANACGALTVRQPGARTAPGTSELKAFLADQGVD